MRAEVMREIDEEGSKAGEDGDGWMRLGFPDP